MAFDDVDLAIKPRGLEVSLDVNLGAVRVLALMTRSTSFFEDRALMDLARDGSTGRRELSLQSDVSLEAVRIVIDAAVSGEPLPADVQPLALLCEVLLVAHELRCHGVCAAACEKLTGALMGAAETEEMGTFASQLGKALELGCALSDEALLKGLLLITLIKLPELHAHGALRTWLDKPEFCAVFASSLTAAARSST